MQRGVTRGTGEPYKLWSVDDVMTSGVATGLSFKTGQQGIPTLAERFQIGTTIQAQSPVFCNAGFNAQNGVFGLTFVGSEVGTAGNIPCTLDLRGGRGSGTTLQNNLNGDVVAQVLLAGGTRFNAQPKIGVASIKAIATENYTDDGVSTMIAYGTQLQFNATANGTATNHGNPAMTLDPNVCSITGQLNTATVALGAKTASYNVTTIANGTTVSLTTNPLSELNGLVYAPAITMSGGAIASTNNGIKLAPTVTLAVGQGALAWPWRGFFDTPIVRASTGTANLMTGTYVSFMSFPSFQSQDANAQTITAYNAFSAGAAFVSGGSLTLAALSQFLAAAVAVPANTTISTMVAYNVGVPVPSGGGAIGSWTGLNIPAMTAATTNVGIQCVPQALFGTGGGVRLNVDGTAAIATQTLGTKTANFTVVDVANGATATVATNQATITYMNFAPAVTLSVVLGELHGVTLAPTITTTTSPVTDAYRGFSDQPTFQNTAGSANMAMIPKSFQANANFKTIDTTPQTVTSYTGFRSVPAISVFAGGALTMTAYTAFESASFTNPTGSTIATFTAFKATNPTVTGPITTYLGLDIPAAVGPVTSIGMRCAPAIVEVPTVVTVTGNAATIPVTCCNAKLTNSSAATITITLATANAQDGQILDVRIYDATNLVQNIVWVNHEVGKTSPPGTTMASTTVATHVQFMFNSVSSKWTCIGL